MRLGYWTVTVPSPRPKKAAREKPTPPCRSRPLLARPASAMSNFELIELDSLECEAYQTKEVLKILIHSIIFQRALGACRLSDAESDLFDLSYVRCESRSICQRVEEHAEAFSSALERSAAQAAATAAAQASSQGGAPAAPLPRLPARICVDFVERRSRPSAFGLFRGEEKVTWERWHIALSVRSPEPHASELANEGGLFSPHGGAASNTSDASARRRQQVQLADDLRARLEVILATASSRKEHIPPADGLGADDSTAWFEVTSDSESWTGLQDLFKLGFGRGSFKPF